MIDFYQENPAIFGCGKNGVEIFLMDIETCLFLALSYLKSNRNEKENSLWMN